MATATRLSTRFTIRGTPLEQRSVTGRNRPHAQFRALDTIVHTMSTPLPEKISHVLESCLYATDLAAAERFYGEVLGLALHGKQPGRHVFFHCGERMVLIFNPAESS